MVRLLALALLLPSVGAAAAQPSLAGPAYVIERSLVTSIAAPDGTAYRVMVAWPEGVPPAQGWPVLYLLDGEDNFAIAVQTARRLARSPRGGVSAGIIVGIESPGLARRVQDYTPATPGWMIAAGAPAHGLPTGGANTFLTFINGTVAPLISGRWRTDATRQTLAGHSFGGLLALHALLARPGSFTRFVAISPSLWFGGDLIAREERAASTLPVVSRVLIATGGAEGGPDPQGVDVAAALAARLRQRGLSATFQSLAGANHGATMLVAMPMLLATAFDPEPKR